MHGEGQKCPTPLGSILFLGAACGSIRMCRSHPVGSPVAVARGVTGTRPRQLAPSPSPRPITHRCGPQPPSRRSRDHGAGGSDTADIDSPRGL